MKKDACLLKETLLTYKTAEVETTIAAHVKQCRKVKSLMAHARGVMLAESKRHRARDKDKSR